MTQATIGALRVDLGLNSAKFQSGVKRANKSLQGMRQQFAAFSAAAATIGAALGGITKTVVESANEVDRFAKVANAAPARFQKMAAAARTAGISQEKLADQLKDVNDRVGDFLATGGGPMADFFEKIAPRVGVTAEQFRNLSGPDALQLYVDSLQKANLSQGEMTFYMEAMASDLTQLLPLLKNGGAEMERMGKRAKQFGAVLSAEAIGQLRRTHVALQEVGLVFKGFANQIATAVAPSVEAMANAFSDLALEGQPLNRAITLLTDNIERLSAWTATAVAAVGTRLAWAMGAAALGVRGLTLSLQALRVALMRIGLGAVVVVAGEAVYQFGRLVSATGGFGEALTRLKAVAVEVWERIKDAIDTLPLAMEAATASMEVKFLRGLESMLQSFQDFTNKVVGGLNDTFKMSLPYLNLEPIQGMGTGSLSKAAAAAERNASRLGGKLSDAMSGLGAPLKSVQALRDLMKGAETAAGGAADAAERINRALAGATGGGAGGDGGGGGNGNNIAREFTEIEMKAKSVADTIRSSFTDAFKGAVTGAKTLGEAVTAALRRISDALLNSVGNAMFGGFANSITSALFKGIPGFTSIPGFASGTNFAPGGLAMVGERGPELVNLPRGSQVVPNHRLDSLGGSARVEVVPSPYFDVRVSEVSRQANAPAIAGVARAGRQGHGARSQQFSQRGTMT
ncbi:hypothetical protein [Tranquillimonas alkanivorans]|uniref:Phage tail tape measure protein, lambda family n=1 Tax=Tranquillimonas alkanivorans TaxID=441119 RepID=A0A1I5L197_9RHOB|nr:hypothetical protein [Tranquillimonas alkanivorans]SFO91100.1 hypothetical protein SAMN04488047_101413 [Tranquillimonas alkanivorans]